MILRSQDDWDFDDSNQTNYPILTNNLVSGQQDYRLPTTSLQLKRVEITYDGTNWFKVTRFDIGTRKEPSASNAISDFAKSSPYYDVQFGSLFIYPIPDANVSNGIKVWIDRQPTEFTSADLTAGTASPGFDSLFHQLLAYGASYDYALAKNLTNREALKRAVDEMTVSLQNYYGRKIEDGNLTLGSAYADNEQYK